MEKYIHQQNLILFMRHLADPDLSDAQRKTILRLLSEEHAKGRQPCPLWKVASDDRALNHFSLSAPFGAVENADDVFDAYQRARTSSSAIGDWGGPALSDEPREQA
jgi:hypothetical protein